MKAETILKTGQTGGHLTRRKFLQKVACALGIGLGVTASDAIGFEPTHPVVERVRLRLPRWPQVLNGLKVCQLSDLHRSRIVSQKEIAHAVQLTNELRPDLVLLTGDFVTYTSDWSVPCARALQSLRAPLGVFACLGNHDHWTDPEVVQSNLEDVGISVLRNQSQRVQTGGGEFYLAGLDDVWERRQNIEASLRDVPRGAFTMMMVHEPDYADEVAKHPVDVQFSGHSHGGQVRLPIIGSPILPLWGRKYPAGLYRIGKMLLYTNRGVGRIPPAIRFNCRPEITLFELVSA